MAKYSVQLSVDMDADTPEIAAEMVAEMSDGWTYEVYDEETNTVTEVHLEYGVAQK